MAFNAALPGQFKLANESAGFGFFIYLYLNPIARLDLFKMA